MKPNSLAGAIAIGLVIVAGLMTLMFEDHGWVWPPVLLALLLGGAVARGLGH
jgi:hypothetical protein